MFEQLIKKIKEILEANDQIDIVYTFEVGNLKGDPAAVVVPSSNENEFNTTQENIRLYAFTINLFVKRNSPRTPEDAERITRNLVTSVIDDFDKDFYLSEFNNPTGYTFINWFAAPSSWGYAGENDEYRVGTVNLTARVSVDRNSIT